VPVTESTPQLAIVHIGPVSSKLLTILMINILAQNVLANVTLVNTPLINVKLVPVSESYQIKDVFAQPVTSIQVLLPLDTNGVPINKVPMMILVIYVHTNVKLVSLLLITVTFVQKILTDKS